MNKPEQLVTFRLDDQRYAVYVSAVETIRRIVEISPLPKSPEIVLGIVNVQGRIIPVINIRMRFRLPEKELNLSDQLIIACTSRRTVALVVEAVTGVVKCLERDLIPSGTILPDMEYVHGVAILENGITLIHDLDQFLSLEEEKKLDDALVTDVVTGERNGPDRL